jgi:HD-GYP domain-containing protein (c-di-GMP phosphodiesterase class II)
MDDHIPGAASAARVPVRFSGARPRLLAGVAAAVAVGLSAALLVSAGMPPAVVAVGVALFGALALALVWALAEAARQTRRAEALLEITRRLNAELDLPAVLSAISTTTAAALGMPLVYVLLADPSGRRLVHAHDVGLNDDARQMLRAVPLDEHTAFAERYGRMALVPDMRGVSGLPGSDALALAGARTVVTAELRRVGVLIGTLTVASVGAPRRFGADAMELLGGLADHAVQAITNARLHATTRAQALANARLYAATERRLRHVRALHAIDNAILASKHHDEALAVVLERSCAELEIDIAVVWLIEPGTTLLVGGRASGLRQRVPVAQVALRGTLAAEAAARRDVVWRVAGAASARAHEALGAPHLAGEEVAFVAAAPLIASGTLLGVLEVAHRAPREPDSEWLDFLRTLAGQAAIAVDYVRVLEDLAQANDRLVEAYDTTLAGWARALDLRDHDTAGHCERVTELTVALARMVGMSDEQLIQVRRGALLHDIGKLGVPDAILLKPGALSAAERAVIERHPVYAQEWLAPIAFLSDALDIPFAHHERWDGSGYPLGLCGEAIPLAARLFAVVDVWDALTSDRPYRPALPPAVALAYIESQAGTHFEPRIVAAFRMLVEDSFLQQRALGE